MTYVSKRDTRPMSVTNPELALEFHPTKNGDIGPAKIVAGTGKKLWWICKDCEHEWQAPGSRRKNRGSGCPACSNHAIHIDGRNSMEKKQPKIAKEFHPTKNGDLTPDNLLPGTSKRLWWICEKCQHEWIATGSDRLSGKGCPACSNHRVHVDGRNSLGALFPEIADEMHPEKNGDIHPFNVLPGTDKKLFWICKTCNHEWFAHGYSRTGKNKTGCPACANLQLHIDGSNSLKSKFPNISEEWHSENELPPEKVLAGSGKKAKWKCKDCQHSWFTSVANRTGEKKTGCPACRNLEIHEDGRNSLAVKYPNIAAEFDYQKNYPITPHNIVSGTNKKVWWICKECDWEWDCSVIQRTKDNATGCPSCYGRTSRPGKKAWLSLESPSVARQFHPTKNGDISADKIRGGSSRKVWWLCEVCENEWEARISSRTSQGAGCPFCSGNSLHSDKRNSILNTHPELIKELHPSKNAGIDISELMAGSSERLVWICKDCDHEWDIPLTNRAHNGSGCPVCANLAIHIDGRNSLAKVNPKLSEELHPTKNGDFTADNIIPGSSKKFWWKCKSCTHEWRASPDNRNGRGRGCPACNNKVIHIDGRNSMTSMYPDMARQFHPTKNGKMTPETTIAGSHKKIWWVCYDCDHEWKTSPGGRISNDSRKIGMTTGCPACTNQVVHIDGRNSFLNSFPDLAKEIHPTKNKSIDPSKIVLPGKIWWVCSECSFEWFAESGPRVYRGVGCPACSESGYNPSKIGFLYIYHYIDMHKHWLKCGITNDPLTRISSLRTSANKHNLEIIELDMYKFDDGEIPRLIERELLGTELIRYNSKYNIQGKNEFFKYDALNEIKEIISNWV
uniref:Zinc-ribbon domain-containing protein n=1 Tax=uncultured Poseidoniia archaeon TaxID=1697135 RepID=A0A1B1TAA2_9ARCH|nr:hypothetical protein [uncultured Candidatus Thalassoarchaea sp.]